VYAEEKGHSSGDDIDLINDVIEAQNDNGNQEIASTDCHQPVSGFVDGDIVQDCNALAANGDISQETTEVDNGDGVATCEECLSEFLVDIAAAGISSSQLAAINTVFDHFICEALSGESIDTLIAAAEARGGVSVPNPVDISAEITQLEACLLGVLAAV
jgi:hypothetical protein